MSGSEPNFVMMTDDQTPKNADQIRRQALELLQRGVEEQIGEDGYHSRQHFVEPEQAAPTAAPAPARAFMIGVVTMPAVFLAVVMGALALFGKPAATEKTPTEIAAVETLEQPTATAATRATFASAHSSAPRMAISLDEDMRIADISLDGDRVALHVESPMGQEILIYDYAKGRVIAEAPIETAAVEAVDSLAMLTGVPQPAPKPIAAEKPAEAKPAAAEADVAATPRAPTIKPRGAN